MMALAFAPPAPATSFTGRRVALSTRPVSPTTVPLRLSPRMQDGEKKGLFSNPFARKPAPPDTQPSTTFTEPQAGDPGFKPLAPVPKGFGMNKSEPKKSDAKASGSGAAAKDGEQKPTAKTGGGKTTTVAQKGSKVSKGLPVQQGTIKRGIDLLREDFLKNAPERAGVGRQDRDNVTMKPVAGEPGYKPESYRTVKVSELGISPFPDDANAVGKVGGIEAVRKAATDVKKGLSAKEIKKAVLSGEAKISTPTATPAKAQTPISTTVKTKTMPQPEEKKPVVFDIPDYLKPLPEDTPRKGMTWKNYIGR